MAGLKPPDDAEVELCENCGLPPYKVDPTIPITLLFSKATRQVLCLEAGKDFVDTLLGFLTLPMGCIIKLLEEALMIHRPESKTAPPPCGASPGLPYTPMPKTRMNESGEHFSLCSISNIFDSVVRLDTNEMSADKKCLVDPKPAIPFGAGKLLALPVTPSPLESSVSTELPVNYGCGNACSFYTSSPGTKCPKHKKKMSVPFELVEPGASDSNDQSHQSEIVQYVRVEKRYFRVVALLCLLDIRTRMGDSSHKLTDLQKFQLGRNNDQTALDSGADERVLRTVALSSSPFLFPGLRVGGPSDRLLRNLQTPRSFALRLGLPACGLPLCPRVQFLPWYVVHFISCVSFMFCFE